MSDPNRIPVFQHSAAEHFGISCRKGESISGLGHYDALWVMGGPMDVWQENKHPWLQMEATKQGESSPFLRNLPARIMLCMDRGICRYWGDTVCSGLLLTGI